ncbi:MAG: hypothetical protein OET44_11870 [Gammaproteobacteria bacterium]|nr:hypothetical protein [Gammaproteobacteria bacterium]
MRINSVRLTMWLCVGVFFAAGCDNAERTRSGQVTPVAGLRINDSAVIEGDAGTTQMTFYVTVPVAPDADITFDYATGDGSAIASEDYLAAAGSGTIAAGSTQTTLSVNVLGDDDSHLAFGNEADEFFTLTLSNVSANVESIALSSASGTIENDEGFTEYTAAVVTVAPDFASGAHSLIRNDAGTLSALNDIAPTHSDLNIAAAGQKAYRIERFEGANVAKFDRDDDIGSPEWQYSVRDSGDSAAQTNPRALAVAHASKAYLTRYEKNTAWIVNPAARTFAQFKLGELDLGAYADTDGIVEMAAAVTGAGRLFIAMQRLDRNTPFFSPNNTAYIAVFDIETDEEIDTGRDPRLKGIPLSIRNPNNDLVVVSADNALYVQGVGDYQGASSGGVERIDLTTYASQVLVADDALGSTHGKTSAMAIASPSKGYLVGYAGFGDSTLFSFDPSTGVVGPPLAAAFANIDIADISIGPAGNLWISDASNATVHLLDTGTDTVIDTVVTNLNPQQMVFFTAP